MRRAWGPIVEQAAGIVRGYDTCDTVFFGGLGIIGLLASADTLVWLQQWAGEISNVALVVIAFLSIVIRRPFTLQRTWTCPPRE